MDKLANVLAEQFNCTVEYAKQHIPELMHDYCVYKGIVSLILAVICIAAIIACIALLVYVIKNYRKAQKDKCSTVMFDWWDFHGEASLTGIGTLAVVCAPIIMACAFITATACTFDMIEAFCFPNVYILEKVLEVI